MGVPDCSFTRGRSFRALLLLICSVVVTVPVRTHCYAATEVSRASEESDLIARFWAEYPPAVERLRSASRVMSGRWQFRQRSMQNQDGHLFEVTFYKDGDNIRFDRALTGRTSPDPKDRTAQNIGILSTQGLVARVHDPATNHAYAENQGVNKKRVDADVSIQFSRFVKAAYCLDNVEFLDKIKDKSYKIVGAKRHPLHDDWVTLHCDLEETSGKYVARGKVIVTLSPSEDWSIREFHLENGRPYNFAFNFTNLSLMRLGHSYVPQELIWDAYDTSKVEVKQADRDGTWMEGFNFRMVEAKVEPPSPELFTMASLGVGPRQTLWERSFWWILAVIVGMVVIRACVKKRSRTLLGVAP